MALFEDADNSRAWLLGSAPAGVRGKIKRAPSSVDEPAWVTIESFDGGVNEHGPCPWQPRVDDAGLPVLPSVGDLALIVEDEEEIPWIVSWWPYEL